jgi:hypothetical protein
MATIRAGAFVDSAQRTKGTRRGRSGPLDREIGVQVGGIDSPEDRTIKAEEIAL